MRVSPHRHDSDNRFQRLWAGGPYGRSPCAGSLVTSRATKLAHQYEGIDVCDESMSHFPADAGGRKACSSEIRQHNSPCLTSTIKGDEVTQSVYGDMATLVVGHRTSCELVSSAIELVCQNIQGVRNVLADKLSRHYLVDTEWCLKKSVVKAIFLKMGEPMIDLFVTVENRQVSIFCFRHQDQLAFYVDALTQLGRSSGLCVPSIFSDTFDPGSSNTVQMCVDSDSLSLASPVVVAVATGSFNNRHSSTTSCSLDWRR